MDTDHIEKHVIVRASCSRIWHALTCTDEFAAWFGVSLQGTFTPGGVLQGHFTLPDSPSVTIEIRVERMEPEQLLSFRWHPYAIDPHMDYSQEPTTLVEIHLLQQGEETHITVIESGFDQIPVNRRSIAFRKNDAGWSNQMENLAHYVCSN